MEATDDFNDVTWDQAQRDEQHRREQEMLRTDPGYNEFLNEVNRGA